MPVIVVLIAVSRHKTSSLTKIDRVFVSDGLNNLSALAAMFGGLVLSQSGESRMPQMVPMTRLLAHGHSPDPVQFGTKRSHAIRGEGLPWDPPAWRGAREHTLPPASRRIATANRPSASAPNRLSRNMPNLGCATDADRASIIDSMSVTGRSLSMLRTSCRIVFAALDVLSVVLATTTAPQNGACAYGTYIMGPGSWCNETSRTSPTIPTISRQDAQTHRARATFFRPRASDTTLRLPVTDPEAAHPDLPSELKI